VDPGERAALVERLTKDRRADDILLRFGKPAGASTRRASATSSRGRRVGVLSCFTDVTSDQVLAEQALRADEQRLAGRAALTRPTA
jgi:hypothetical protein